MNQEQFRRVDHQEFYSRLLSKSGSRSDGRKLVEIREMTISSGTLTCPSLISSCTLRLGETLVLCTVSAELCKEAAIATDSLNAHKGKLNVHISKPSVCSGVPGNPSNSSQTLQLLSQTISDTLVTSKVLDLSELSVQTRDHTMVWVLDVNINVLSDDGGLLRACLGAVVESLSTCRLPERQLDDGTIHVGGNSLVLHERPWAVVVSLVCGEILLDPSLEELELAQCTLQVVVDGSGRIYSLEKLGGILLDPKILDSMIETVFGTL